MNYDIINENVDIKENTIYNINEELLSILLIDHSSGRNIIWATDNYINKGLGYGIKDEITIEKVTGYLGQVIKPRIKKSKLERNKRIRDKAEVFTPSWICNQQNNLIDNSWFGREEVFNKEMNHTWITNKEKISFPKNKTWQEYVLSNRLEISCGEAPYLVSRYDTVTGEVLEINNRIGILDRKIRVITENANDELEWLEWVIKAYKATFGFEYQGDSVLIARENLLYTFIDYYFDKFKNTPSIDILQTVAEIISWNIWQMDGLKGVIPNSCKNDKIIVE